MNVSDVDVFLAAVMPLVLSFIMRPPWSPQLKSLVALGVCALAAVVKCVALGELNMSDMGASIISVMAIAQALYHGFWKHGPGPTVENLTSPRNQRRGKHAAS